MRLTVLGLLLAMPALAAEGDWSLSVNGMFLGKTRSLHGLSQATDLGPGANALLSGLTLEAGTWSGSWGMSWGHLSYAAGARRPVTVVNKDGTPPDVLGSARMHLFIVRLPAPRARLVLGPLTLSAQATLGMRTGAVFENGVGAIPMELMLPVRGALGLSMSKRFIVEASGELLHSLATGAPSLLVGVGLRTRI